MRRSAIQLPASPPSASRDDPWTQAATVHHGGPRQERCSACSSGSADPGAAAARSAPRSRNKRPSLRRLADGSSRCCNRPPAGRTAPRSPVSVSSVGTPHLSVQHELLTPQTSPAAAPLCATTGTRPGVRVTPLGGCGPYLALSDDRDGRPDERNHSQHRQARP